MKYLQVRLFVLRPSCRGDCHGCLCSDHRVVEMPAGDAGRRCGYFCEMNGVDLRFKLFCRMGAIAVIWSLWLCRNDKFLMIKIHLSCRYFIDAQVYSVRGPHYNVWKIEAFLWWRLHDWSTQRGIFLPNMGGLGIFI